MEAPQPTTVGSLLRCARQRVGLSQLELATRLGVNQSWVSKVERDAIALHLRQFTRLALLLEMSPAEQLEVLGAVGPHEPEPAHRAKEHAMQTDITQDSQLLEGRSAEDWFQTPLGTAVGDLLHIAARTNRADVVAAADRVARLLGVSEGVLASDQCCEEALEGATMTRYVRPAHRRW